VSCGGEASNPRSRSEDAELTAGDLEGLVLQQSDVPSYLEPAEGATGPNAEAAESLGAVAAYRAGFERAESQYDLEKEPLEEVISTAYLFDDGAAAAEALSSYEESVAGFTQAGGEPAVAEVPVEGLPEGSFGLLTSAFVSHVSYGWQDGRVFMVVVVSSALQDVLRSEGLEIAQQAVRRGEEGG
jgi:hypothetical protein